MSDTIRVTDGDTTEDTTIEQTVEGYGNTYHKVDGEDVRVTVEDGEATARVNEPKDVDGETFEFHDMEFEVRILSSELKLKDADSGAGLHIIERDGWELDPYVMYACIPHGLAKELKRLGFEYERKVEPMRDGEVDWS